MVDGPRLRVLVLAGSGEGGASIDAALRHGGIGASLRIVQDRSGFDAALPTFKPQLVIVEHSIPSEALHEALEHARADHPTVPCLVLTAPWAVDDGAGQAGAVLATTPDLLPETVRWLLDRAAKQRPPGLANVDARAAHEAWTNAGAAVGGLFGASFDGSFITSPDGRILDMNPKGIELLGYDSLDDIRRLDLQRDVYANPDDRARILGLVQEHGSAEYDVDVRQKSGNVINTHCLMSAVRDAAGTVISYHGIISDITERKRAERELLEAERQFRLLAENSTDLISRLAPDGTWLYASPACRQLTGYDPDELVGRPFDGCAHPDDATELRSHLATLGHGAASERLEHRFRRKDGSFVWLETVARPIRDGEALTEIQAASRDVTERRRAAQALHESEAGLSRIIANANDGVCLLDASGHVTFVNTQFAEMIGYTPEELVGRGIPELMFDEDVPDHEQRMKRRRLGKAEHYERRFRHRNGTPIWTLAAATPVFDGDQRFAGSFAMFTDITERRRTEEEVRTLNRELERQVLQYRMLMDQASDAIFVSDAERRYIDVNDAACEMLGYSRDELLELSVWDIVPPDSNPGQESRFGRMGSGETVLSERVLRRKDGGLIVTELNSRRLPDGRFQAIVRDITARKRLEAEQARLATAVEQADEAIVITDPAGTIVYVNPSFERISGYGRDELVGANPRILHSGHHDHAFYAAMWSTLTAGQTWRGTLVNRAKDGAIFEEESVITPIRDGAGGLVGYVGVKRDVTRERALEEQLRQSQKMESIGQLAGGIAHDFNNLITAIRGYSELFREDVPEDSPGRADIDQVILAADRAADLTRQLLAFSRRQVLQPRLIEPAHVVESLAPLLRRLLGEHIELVTRAEPGVGTIRVDPSQLEQVIVNLAVNARDAMPSGGRLVIEMENSAEGSVGSAETPDEALPRHSVVLRVTDTGCGMDAETQKRAFEPFFTTKEPGSGTGMGLATVYGIVKQSGGVVFVASAPGRGTTFTIQLPRVDPMDAISSDAAGHSEVAGGTETILLVEDDSAVRTVSRRVLEALGYTVLEAANGEEAAARATGHAGQIDLLVTDVVMPRMGGHELVGLLETAGPGRPVLFISGFPELPPGAKELAGPGAIILPKPFTREALARAVRQALEGRPR